MATEETTITELELAEEVLADMVIPVDTSTDTKSVSLKQLRAWLGSSLPTGFILPAVGKINDGRFTLLDGKTLSKQGTYGAFCAKVEAEVQAGNWLACTEEEYNADITAYNQCGKFVIGVDYVRIPTITRFIGATITLSEIGKTYKESLPNIKGYSDSFDSTSGWQEGIDVNGAFYKEQLSKTGRTTADSSQNFTLYRFGFDASLSSSTYKDGAKVQPDHTKYPYYMVISTEGQTAEVEIDINKVYEDLELKANKSLSNLTAEGKSVVSGFGMPSNRYTDLTLGASGSSYKAPANGWVSFVKKTSAVNQYIELGISNSIRMRDNNPVSGSICEAMLPVRKDQSFYASYTAGGDLTWLRFVYAEGEN